MKLNKKYQPQSKVKIQQEKKSDTFFPIFFPKYQKIDGEGMSDYFSQYLEQSRYSKKEFPIREPLIITGGSSRGYTKLLAGKHHLPLPAKIQRFATHEQKMLKKGLPLLQQIFFQEKLTLSDSTLTDPKFQSLLTLFKEKNLRKQTQELVRRDVSTQAIVYPDDIERKEEKTIQLEIKCFVETKNDVFPLVVEDPLLLFSDVGVVVHENDKRYKKHIGKKIIIPVINKSIPIFGEKNIDTIKDYGIQRLNPLFSPQTLERVKAYELPTDESYIDDQGHFTEKVANFSGKSVFEFTENIVETLATIWNLANQQEIIKQIPYSKETGQRLIRKVISTIVLDLSEQKTDFLSWLSESFPQFQSFFTEEDTFRILVESRNPYAQKISFLSDAFQQVRIFSFSAYQDKLSSAFSLFLLDQLRKGNLSWNFTRDELIDVLFLVPEQEWKSLAEQSSLSLEELLATQKAFKTEATIENFRDTVSWALGKISWLELKENMISFLPEQLWWKDQLWTLAVNDSFLQILTLLSHEDNHFVLHNAEFWIQFLKELVLLIFITGKAQNFSFLESKEALLKTPPLPEKALKLKEVYGWETIRLLLARQQKCEEPFLDENFDYLKHLWNLFKILYEQGIFSQAIPEQLQIWGKEFWIYSQWNELEQNFADEVPNTLSFVQKIETLQHFTREQFSWYLALIKEENNSEAWRVAWEIFCRILLLLEPLIPEFMLMIERNGEEKNFSNLLNVQITGTKDYKMHLLFDILKGIVNKKAELHLKKHFPIELVIQANSDILHLLESYENTLKQLFKIEKSSYFTANEILPSDFEFFTILDITIGIKAFSVTKEEDILAQLERDLKSKSESLEYLRTTLMALSLNPLADPVKMSEKEAELETLKTEIQHLEIKIQKAKMAKKL